MEDSNDNKQLMEELEANLKRAEELRGQLSKLGIGKQEPSC